MIGSGVPWMSRRGFCLCEITYESGLEAPGALESVGRATTRRVASPGTPNVWVIVYSPFPLTRPRAMRRHSSLLVEVSRWSATTSPAWNCLTLPWNLYLFAALPWGLALPVDSCEAVGPSRVTAGETFTSFWGLCIPFATA